MVTTLGDTDSAEGHCYPATMYLSIVRGIVVESNTVGLTLNGLFYDEAPSFSAIDVEPIYISMLTPKSFRIKTLRGSREESAFSMLLHA